MKENVNYAESVENNKGTNENANHVTAVEPYDLLVPDIYGQIKEDIKKDEELYNLPLAKPHEKEQQENLGGHFESYDANIISSLNNHQDRPLHVAEFRPLHLNINHQIQPLNDDDIVILDGPLDVNQPRRRDEARNIFSRFFSWMQHLHQRAHDGILNIVTSYLDAEHDEPERRF